MKFLKYLIIFLLIIVSLVAAAYLFRETIITSILEKSGSKINKAKVEVENLKNPFFTTVIKWDNLKITNSKKTMRNLIETGFCEFELKAKPLFAGKFIVETIELSHIKTDTKRETDGKIKLPPEKKRKKEKSELTKIIEAKLKAEKKKIPIFNPKQLKTNINVDELLAELNFKTPEKADSIKTYVKNRRKHWESRWEKNDYEKDIKNIRQDIRKINPKKIEKKKDDFLKLAEEIKKQLNTLKKVEKNSKKIYKELKNDKNALNKDIKKIKKLRYEIPELIKKDYQNALDLAELPDVQLKNVGNMLFGEKLSVLMLDLIQKLKDAQEIAKKSQEIEPSKSEKKEKLPHLPKFWIKKIAIKGELPNGNIFSGKINDISSNQDKTRKPIIADITAKFPHNTTAAVKTIFDLRNNNNLQKIYLDAKNIRIKNTKISNFALLPKKIKKAKTSITSNTIIDGNKFLSQNKINTTDLKFDLNSRSKNINKELKNISDQLISSINAFDINFTTGYNNDNFNYSLQSNLDNLIGNELKKIIDEKVGKAKRELERKVKRELRKYEREVRTVINNEIRKLNKEIQKLTGSSELNIKEIGSLEKELKNIKDREFKKYKKKAEEAGEDALKKIKEKIDWP